MIIRGIKVFRSCNGLSASLKWNKFYVEERHEGFPAGEVLGFVGIHRIEERESYLFYQE